MGKWCLHASSFIFDQIVIKVAGNQDRHKSSDEFDFRPLVSMAHLYVFEMRLDLGTLDSGERSLPFGLLVLNEIWPWHIGLRWAIVALWATYLKFLKALQEDTGKKNFDCWVGHCSLGSRVPLTSTVGWDTEAWVRVYPSTRLLGGTLKPGLECPPQLNCWVGHYETWVCVSC